MSHIRQEIRDDIIRQLTGLATTGDNVFASRIYPISNADLPGICVYTLGEESEYRTFKNPRSIRRELTVAIEVYVKANTGYDDTIDQIALEIESALADDLTRNGYAKDTRFGSTSIEFSDEGEKPIAMMTLTVSVDYFTTEGSPEPSPT